MRHKEFKYKEFSKAIKAKRKKDALSLRGLSHLDISASTISRLENENTPDLIVYAKMCKWLGEPLEKYLN